MGNSAGDCTPGDHCRLGVKSPGRRQSRLVQVQVGPVAAADRRPEVQVYAPLAMGNSAGDCTPGDHCRLGVKSPGRRQSRLVQVQVGPVAAADRRPEVQAGTAGDGSPSDAQLNTELSCFRTELDGMLGGSKEALLAVANRPRPHGPVRDLASPTLPGHAAQPAPVNRAPGPDRPSKSPVPHLRAAKMAATQLVEAESRLAQEVRRLGLNVEALTRTDDPREQQQVRGNESKARAEDTSKWLAAEHRRLCEAQRTVEKSLVEAKPKHAKPKHAKSGAAHKLKGSNVSSSSSSQPPKQR
eukprot:gnl/TRDRNA2_/TRDRNA2_33914_c0_seq1.p1 gnl/TRDRNA2_/TRDRNA2_33914_c0~~gnl/TRDRNA2_/TRDRNA2_33914_c0_seq1.p1  ORF type:complete len:298 (-),score=65.44 gnl/TRDRNA2_/TRDRNA2_33914_c0_seq1:40-933(-)